MPSRRDSGTSMASHRASQTRRGLSPASRAWATVRSPRTPRHADREELYRQSGAVGPTVTTAGAGPQSQLLAAFGRDSGWTSAHTAVTRIADAFGAGDVDAIMAAMTDDCVFESTSPAPDGTRVVGAEAVRQVWADLFGQTPEARFETEEVVVAGDRGVLRWRFSWGGDDPGHVRGIDLLRVTGGKVSEKLSYVKG